MWIPFFLRPSISVKAKYANRILTSQNPFVVSTNDQTKNLLYTSIEAASICEHNYYKPLIIIRITINFFHLYYYHFVYMYC